MTLKAIPFVAPKILVIFSLLPSGCIVHGLKYDKAFNVQPKPIHFSEEPKDHVTLAGADVTFVCSITMSMSVGMTMPHTTWLYNNTKITSGRYHIISHNGSSTLTVKNVTTDDQGVYHCCLDDWKIKIRSKYGHLNVLESKNQTTIIKAKLESTITLQFSLELPGIKPTWYKDGIEIVNKANQVMLEDGRLVLLNVNKDSGGHYLYSVNESSVITHKSFCVVIQESSKNNSRIRIGNASSSQYLLIVPNHCDKSPDNQTVKLQCPVTGHPRPVISWYLNGNLVDLTDYNITDNVDNNTWTIQGGGPCRLIGYWQCFATNEAGTVHYEIRVLPYGWSTLPRSQSVNAFKVVQQKDEKALASFNISWQQPLYLGGLNLSDLKYDVTIYSYRRKIATYNTNYNTTHVIMNWTVKEYEKLHVRVDIICKEINCKYLPNNVHIEATYDGKYLVKAAINFLPPKFNLNCFANGSVLLDWSPRSYGNLSSEYINGFIYSWAFTGSCIDQQGNVFLEYEYSNDTIGHQDNSYMFNNLSNGTLCNYTASYVYMNEFMSPSSRAYCIINDYHFTSSSRTVNISTSILFSSSQIIVSSSGISSGGTATGAEISTTPVYSLLQKNSSYLSTSLDVTKPSHVTFVQMNFLTLSIPNVNSTSTRYSTTTTSSVITNSSVHSDKNNTGLSSGLLVTIIGLVLLLVISAIICITAVVMYQHKSHRYSEDYNFLRFSQYLKNMRSPLSNNYCSTINIADDSVCEMPVSKVMKWIDNNDFKQSTDVLQQTSSFHSLPTSEMIAYICKKGKNGKQKWPVVDDSTKLKVENLGFLDNISCSQISTSSDVPSHYHCEDKPRIFSSWSGAGSDDNSQCNSEVVTLSEDSSLQLPTDICTNKKPTDLFISEKHKNMPLFTPKVTNPIFANASPSSLPKELASSQSFNKADLLNDILHTLPHEEVMVDNTLLSQMSNESDVPSHYMCEGNHCNKEGSLSSLDCDDFTDPHNSSTNGEELPSQTSENTSCNVFALDHVANKKPPPSLSISKKSATTSIFTPKVTNPIFADNTNSSSADSNSFTSESSLLPQSYSDKDAPSFALHSQLIEEMNDDVFLQTSDVPSHYLCEESCCNSKSQTSSSSLDGSTPFSSDNTNDGNHEMALSLLNNGVFTSKTDLFIPRRSISLPTITPDLGNTNLTSANLGISIPMIESPDKCDSPELCTIFCEQMDDKTLSQLSINDSISSHYMHGEDSSSKENSSHYFDNNQDDHKTDTTSSLPATKINQDASLDCHVNKVYDTNVVYPLSSIFVSSPGLHPTNSLGELTQGESNRIFMDELDLDTLSQFYGSDTNSEFNTSTDLNYNDFNAGYM